MIIYALIGKEGFALAYNGGYQRRVGQESCDASKTRVTAFSRLEIVNDYNMIIQRRKQWILAKLDIPRMILPW